MTRQRKLPLAASVLAVAALTLGACGDDADDTAADTTVPATADEPADEPAADTTVPATADEPADEPAEEPVAEPADEPAEVLQVTMHDFHYGDLPASVPVGTELAFSNASEVELHEFVALRLDDGDERTADEIMNGDVESLFGDAMPAMVVLAPPASSEQIVAVGEPVFTEAGRYLILCAIPTGADPEELLSESSESEGPPEAEGGQPHFMNGMYAVVEVVA